MKIALILSTIALCGTLACTAHAEDAKKAESLAKSNGCMACHTVDNKLVGPSYKDVAAKYRGNKDAEALLMKKVKDGGAGVWGQIPMPPHPGLSDADLKTLVDWVLSSK
ncbi:MAG: c-type cytochrome [Rudaea sp.]